MKNLLFGILSAAAIALAAALAQASGPAPLFVPLDTFDALDMLPQPPAADSPAEKAELDELHKIEASRTAPEVAAARADEAERDIFIFKTVLGDTFNAAALPVTAALSAELEDEVTEAEAIKYAFKRERPYNIDKSLHPVCRTKDKPDSYPSGHAMTGYLMALTLASMLPEKRDAIFARAEAYAHDRLVCGVHHESDVEAGKEIAYALYGALAENPGFRDKRAAAEAEIRKALDLARPANGSGHAD